MASLHSDPHKLHAASEPRALFVGCLDPSTTEYDLANYFRIYDPKITVKLIKDAETHQTKQCAIITCSGVESLKFILSQTHHLHGRLLRVELADEEKKGKKVGTVYRLHISGIETTIELNEVVDVLSEFAGLTQARFVNGLHPKQKKVAIATFESFDSFNSLLVQGKIRIGERDCKIQEYVQKPKPSPYTTSVTDPTMSHSGASIFNNPLNSPPHFSLFPQKNPLLSKSAQYHPPENRAPGSKLSLSLSDRHSSNFVYPVEKESDGLFKIFCHPNDQGVSRSTVPHFDPPSGAKLTESRVFFDQSRDFDFSER
jgi:RNA recognition motif-containing protein